MTAAILDELSDDARAAWLQLHAALLAQPWPTACADDPSAWWSTRAEVVRWALLACAVCPVRRLCAEYAVAAGEPGGVWGATTPEDRGAPEKIQPAGARSETSRASSPSAGRRPALVTLRRPCDG